jgi:hypothetical protein
MKIKIALLLSVLLSAGPLLSLGDEAKVLRGITHQPVQLQILTAAYAVSPPILAAGVVIINSWMRRNPVLKHIVKCLNNQKR